MVVGCWLLVVGCWLLVIGYWLLVVGCWLLVVGYWLLVVGCWLLVIGGWLLVVGYWWLVVGGWLVVCCLVFLSTLCGSVRVCFALQSLRASAVTSNVDVQTRDAEFDDHACVAMEAISVFLECDVLRACCRIVATLPSDLYLQTQVNVAVCSLISSRNRL